MYENVTINTNVYLCYWVSDVLYCWLMGRIGVATKDAMKMKLFSPTMML